MLTIAILINKMKMILKSIQNNNKIIILNKVIIILNHIPIKNKMTSHQEEISNTQSQERFSSNLNRLKQ